MRILVDMDDTIECLLSAWVDRVNEIYGASVTVSDCTDWDTSKAFPGLTREQVYSVIDEPGFWKRVKPFPGAVEGLERLVDEGHEVIVVTSSSYLSLRSKMEDLLFRYFPFISWNDVIVTNKKQLVRGDVLIDDGVHNLIGGEYYKILVDAPYNRAFDAESHGIRRVRGWDEIIAIIDELNKNGENSNVAIQEKERNRRSAAQ